MTVTVIIISCILFAAALALLPLRMLAAPACAFMGLMTLSFANRPTAIHLCLSTARFS